MGYPFIEIAQLPYKNSPVTTSNLAKLILKNHNTGSFGFRKDYFDHLKNTTSYSESVKNEEQATTTQLSQNCIALVNKIYGLLEPYTLELNQSIRDTRYTITPSPPAFVEEELDERWPYQSSRVVQVYRSRFASIDLCTTIKGFENQVEFYVLPAEYCISQALAEQEYGALMRFTCVDSEWSVEGKPLTNERLERYCLLFFDYFVKENQKLIGKRLAK